MESTITGKLLASGSEVATNVSELINTPQFLTLGYWFETPSSFEFNKIAPLAILSTLLIILVLLILLVKVLNSKLNPPQQKFLTKIIAWLFLFGPLGWLLILFRSQGVAFLSARFWWLLWFIALALVAFYLFRYNQKQLPMQVSQYQNYKFKKKYFPKKKRKR